ncbi:MAG: DUF6265 family protein [Hyphomonas sp.]|nr:DUF6265 family protein [Hyphomonas sp.]
MKHAVLAFSFAATFVGGCALAPAAHADEGLKWMSGCWRTQDQTYKEVWSKPEAGFLFGYALTYDETGALSFFEQARIDGGAPAVYNAYPGGFGPSEFTEESRAKNTVTFANSAHDYPQRIVYARKGSRMTATISLANGARAQTWEFRKC